MVLSVRSAFILLPLPSVTLHESGTRNALSGPSLNNTEVLFNPLYQYSITCNCRIINYNVIESLTL
jgi:hypothetical protein